MRDEVIVLPGQKISNAYLHTTSIIKVTTSQKGLFILTKSSLPYVTLNINTQQIINFSPNMQCNVSLCHMYSVCTTARATDQVGCPVYQAPGYLLICSRPITCRYCASLYNQYINPIQTVLPVAWLPSNTGTLFNLTHDAMVLYCTVLYSVTYGTVLYSTQFLMTYSVVPDTRSCGRWYVKSRCAEELFFLEHWQQIIGG